MGREGLGLEREGRGGARMEEEEEEGFVGGGSGGTNDSRCNPSSSEGRLRFRSLVVVVVALKARLGSVVWGNFNS